MSQTEAEAANREYQQMQQQFASRKQQMDQTMENLKRDEMAKIRKRLEDFLKEYNKDNKYNYIFSYTPEFMFYKDTVYNITSDVIKGLNDAYRKKE
jgi:outer membrane protein